MSRFRRFVDNETTSPIQFVKYGLAGGLAAGAPLGSFIVARISISEYFVFALVLVMSVKVNFLGRKYWVFLH